MLKVLTVYGTRPEAIKLAPVLRAVEGAYDMDSVVLVTGQHREMLDQVNTMFGIEPHYDLSIMRDRQSLNDVVSQVITGVDNVLALERPDVVLVQGDTSSVMAAAIAAFNRGSAVVHLEAGLRSGDISSPFPEEANRRLTAQIARLHLAPTDVSKANLVREGVDERDVVVTGNTVIDTLLHSAATFDVPFSDSRLRKLDRARKDGWPTRVLLVTAHRRENFGENMKEIAAALQELSARFPEVSIVFPLHMNPEVRAVMEPVLSGLPNVILTHPLDYGEFSRALRMADLILTDSGGLQEEAPSLGKPVLVMRENTERPEGVTAGTVKLVGARTRSIVRSVAELLEDPGVYAQMARAVNPYGDGRAAHRTIDAMRWKFSGGPRPADFTPEAVAEATARPVEASIR